MLFVSDVHGAFEALRRLIDTGETVVVLGDLANLTDYRNGRGAIADVLGIDFARAASVARAAGDYEAMRELWTSHVGDRAHEVQSAIGQAVLAQYRDAAVALDGGHGYVIHGNVDRPRHLSESLPDGFEYMHGQARDINGLRFGFVGGGIQTPLKADGEVSDEEMERLLSDLGPVDVLCTHVPPDVGALRGDVITGRQERGSGPIRDYLLEVQPKYHLFGDVHQPQATSWRIGRTRCFNAGYFRATGRFLEFRNSLVHTGRLG
ncbi:MAG: metallophosphoesterase [Actinomycetota bacterium]|nr:metallophosphoesterase [Actinomycetota bacterium]